MILSFKNSLLLLKRTYKQLLFLWLAFVLLVAVCWIFVSSVTRDLLTRSTEDTLANMQTQVTADLHEAEAALRSAAFNIERMIRGGYGEADVREYMEEFTRLVLPRAERISGIDGVYGVFSVFKGAFIDGKGTSDRDPSRVNKIWYNAAVNAKGNVAITQPYYDESDSKWKVTYSRLISDRRGKPLAVIGLDLPISSLKSHFSSIRISKECVSIVADSALNIIVSATDDVVGKPLSVLKSPDIYRIIAELNKGANLSGYKTMDNRMGRGEPVLVYSLRLKNGWHIGVMMPTNTVFKDAYDKLVTIIVLGVLLQLTLSLIVLRIAAANIKAEERSDRKSNFLANMSHEIRTPMNAIIGFAELALREDIPPAVYEHIFTIKQAGANLLSIINDILDFSKIESGKLEIVPSDYLFSSLVNDVVSIIKMRATYSKLRFVVNIDSNIQSALYGDEVRVRQVLLNLLSNAVKYTDKGFVSLNIAAHTPEGATIEEDAVVLKIVVSDSGRGIKKEDVDKLFKDFVQVDKETNKGIEGTGLGLAITHSILKAMNGTISVVSDYGKGSTFTVILPQKVRSDVKHAVVDGYENKNVLVYERRDLYANSVINTIKNLGVNSALVASETELDEKVSIGPYHFIFTAPALYERTKNILQKHKSNAKVVLLTEFGDAIADRNITLLSMPVYSVTVANALNGVSDNNNYGAKVESFAKFIAPDARVLVVDDTNTNLRVAEGLLSPYKMRVDLCRSGPESIEAVQEEHYDLVFMDHMMPGMDGLEATKRIRNLYGDYFRKLPIIALTANAVAGARDMFLSEGLNDFISKPIDIGKLNAAIEKWIPKEKRKSPTEVADGGVSDDGDDVDMRKTKIDGVNVELGLSLSGGRGTYYLRTLTMYYEDGFEKIKEIKNCLDAGDLQLYTTHIHGLKSASASIGAEDLSQKALGLETAGKENNLVYINEHNAQFLMDLEALLHNLGNLLDSIEAAKKKTSGRVDTEMLKAELLRLKEALDKFDSETIDGVTNTLLEYEHAEHFGEGIKAILQNVLIGEYDDALGLIDGLLEKLGVDVGFRPD